MKIERNMNLQDLWERMYVNGNIEFNHAEAAAMRDQLLANASAYEWTDTADVDDTDWFRMLNAVVSK